MNLSSLSLCFRSTRGVTLAELLVTVSIIAVIVAILFPITGAVRQTSENTRCIGRLRALGVGIKAYTGDRNGYLPPGFSPHESTIVKALEPYTAPMKETQMAADVFYCPTNERLGSPPSEGYVRGASGRYKGFAGYFMGYVINASVHPIKGLPEPGDPEPRYRIRANEVKLPGRTVSLLDMVTRAPTATAPPSSGFARAYYFDPAHNNFGVGLVHRGWGNILFVDGHVESFDGSRPLPVQSLPDRDTTWHP